MPDKPRHLAEEWLHDRDTVFALHDPDGQGERNRWWATVHPNGNGATPTECVRIARLMHAAPKLLVALIHCHDWILSQQTAALEGESARLEAANVIAEATGGATGPSH
jgi:hypothetical protein